MSGLWSGFTGLSLGNGLYTGVSGLWSGTSGLLGGAGGLDDGPYLILDFVGGNVPYGSTLDLNFTDQTYTAYAADPAGQGFPNFWAWSD